MPYFCCKPFDKLFFTFPVHDKFQGQQIAVVWPRRVAPARYPDSNGPSPAAKLKKSSRNIMHMAFSCPMPVRVVRNFRAWLHIFRKNYLFVFVSLRQNLM